MDLFGRSVFPSDFPPTLTDIKHGFRAILPWPIFEPTQEGKKQMVNPNNVNLFLSPPFLEVEGELRATSGKHR